MAVRHLRQLINVFACSFSLTSYKTRGGPRWSLFSPCANSTSVESPKNISPQSSRKSWSKSQVLRPMVSPTLHKTRLEICQPTEELTEVQQMCDSRHRCQETVRMRCELFPLLTKPSRLTTLLRNTDCDYSSAYVALLTDSDLVGYGMTFTIGRGNDIVLDPLHILRTRSADGSPFRSALQLKRSRIAWSERTQNLSSLTWGRPGSIWWQILNCDGAHCSLSSVAWRLTCHAIHRIGPEKGVIHIATGAVNNALWDMYARSRQKPLWKLVVDFTPVRYHPLYLDCYLTLFIRKR